MFLKSKLNFFTFIIITIATLFPSSGNASIKDSVSIGGALRFNYRYKSWNKDNTNKGGDFVFDMFAIKAKAQYDKLFLKAEYRFYPSQFGGGILKEGYIGYRISDNNQIVIGTTQVPFGVNPYIGNSYFYNMQYYIGFEDDYDNGIKWTYNHNNWTIDLAYFKNAEGGNSSDNKRYSYDPTTSFQEIGQWNIRVDRSLESATIGASAQYGKILNFDTDKKHNSWAIEGHITKDFLSTKRLNVKLEALYFNYEDMPDHQITMGAYNSSYNVASEASVYSVAVAYKIPIEESIIDYIQIYNDYSYMNKSYSGFNDSQMNVTGMLIAAGPIYTYIDYAQGKNQDWFGPWGSYGPNSNENGMSRGDANPSWEGWFNINIGYYF